MKLTIIRLRRILVTAALAGTAVLAANKASAHCDTLDGPVVQEARTALKAKDITPTLKWIKREHEAELKDAFSRTLAVRSQGKEARELADQFFFETLVRLHRAGEGAPYTGLKPAGTMIDPSIKAADKALEDGRVDGLVKAVSGEIEAGIRARFNNAVKSKQHAGHDVEAGRDYVAAYVEFVHYVEALHTLAARQPQSHGHGASAASPAPTGSHDH